MKYFYSLFFLIIILLSATSVKAGLLQDNTVGDISNNMSVLQDKAGYQADMTIGDVVATIIQAFLGLLGVIFVILIILAGYNWMSAAGDEEKITKAKDTIRAAIIGLIIIVAAYSITYFVLGSLPDGGGGTL